MEVCGSTQHCPVPPTLELLLSQVLRALAPPWCLHWIYEQNQVIRCIPVCAASLLLSQEHWDSSWWLVLSFQSCELCFQSSQPVKYNGAVVSKLYWNSFHITNTLTAITYTSLHSNKVLMAFSRASKQAMIFTTEQSQCSTFIRMVCQLCWRAAALLCQVRRRNCGNFSVLGKNIWELYASLWKILHKSLTHRTLGRWILLLLFLVWLFGEGLMGSFWWILLFPSCLNSNNIDSLIKCLDSGPANKRRLWHYQGRDLYGSQWKSQGLGNDLCLTETSVLTHMDKTISKTNKQGPSMCEKARITQWVICLFFSSLSPVCSSKCFRTDYP